MSFVDMMASDVWSSADIDSKVQALIRSRYSADDELKASRLARKPDQSESDLAFVAGVDTWIADCVQQGNDARADMVLLNEVLLVEAAARRLAMPLVEPELNEDGEVVNQDAIDADLAERAEAQAVMDNASPEAKALYDLRNPPAPEPEPEPEVPEEVEGMEEPTPQIEAPAA
jgi:hypothetical protein